MQPQVNAACEFLGLDPLYVANEGKLVAICAAGRRRRACSPRCARIRWDATPRSSARSIADPHHFVQMDTSFGGRRIVDWLTGEQLPRIC